MKTLRCQDRETVIIPGFEHTFCNALLNYSGELKYKEAKLMHQANIEMEEASLLQVLRIQPKELQKVMLIYKLHLELKIAPEHYFDRFENIKGKLDIIGISPNNDQHIFHIIKNNSQLTEINFYCYSENEKEILQDYGDKRFKVKDVNNLWQRLDVRKPKKYGFRFPDNFCEPLEAICELSDYVENEEEIRNDITSIPPYRIDELCDEAFAELVENGAIESKPKDYSSLKRNFAFISHVATREGVLPPSLLVLLIMKWNHYISKLNTIDNQ